MRDWLYILNPKAKTVNGENHTKDGLLKLAETAPERDWWLSRPRHIAAGDRIWIYLSSPVKEVAAMAEVEGEPYEVTDTDYPWRFSVVLHLQATRALCQAPVTLSALANRHPQGVTGVKPDDLELLRKHAGL